MDSASGDIVSSSGSGNGANGDELPEEEASEEGEMLSEPNAVVEGDTAIMDESIDEENATQGDGTVDFSSLGDSETYPQEVNTDEYLDQDGRQQNELQESANLDEGVERGFERVEETVNSEQSDSFNLANDEKYIQHYAEQDNITAEIEVPVQEELVLGEEQQEDIAREEDFALAYSPGLNGSEGNERQSDQGVSLPEEVGEKNESVADERNEESEDDFDNVVEVEELKPGSDAEDDNTAQHISNSEDDDERRTEEYKLRDESEDDFGGASSESEKDHITLKKMKTRIPSSDEDDKANQDNTTKQKHEAAMKMFDSESEEEKEEVGDLIADIFGESDDEGEEFTGFGAEEVEEKKAAEAVLAKSDSEDDNEGWNSSQAYKKTKTEEEDDSDEGVQDGGLQGMSDFDIMLAKKKEENRRHRKRRDNSTFISDADDIINAMLTKMKEAAEADREANLHRKPALKKLKMLPSVISHLKKQNLKELFVDNGVIAAIADWLSLLPDRSLPHITIRKELLQVLHDLPSVGPETLKHSGIGKAVMILFKHPKEARQNKDLAGRLINKWSRPIFGLNENFKSMTREEREQRDLEQMPQAKRKKLTGASQGEQGDETRGENELGHLRPGEAGFVMRARVPMPSTKDYVVRPKWNVEVDDERDDGEGGTSQMIAKRRRSAGAPRSSKKDERLEKHIRNFAERKKSSKMQRAVKISIEGNKMSIL